MKLGEMKLERSISSETEEIPSPSKMRLRLAEALRKDVELAEDAHKVLNIKYI